MLQFWLYVRTTILYGDFLFFIKLDPHHLWEGLKPPQKSPIFKHFLIQLECWNFDCGLRPPFCMRIFRIFQIRPLYLPWDPRKNFAPPPKKKKKSRFSYLDFWTLSDWARMLTFSVWLEITVLYEAFSNLWNQVPLPSSGSAKVQILHLLADFYEIWNITFSYVHQ